MTALIAEILLPHEGERSVHGNASFESSYYERAMEQALAAGAGIAFMHSHLTSGWQGMSRDDITTEQNIAASTLAATGIPLVGMTIGTDGAWSARYWQKTAPHTFERKWCQTVRVVGEELRVTYNDQLLPPPELNDALMRTISAWGRERQNHLARLRFGIVGAGSVGSIIAESLARMGVEHLLLLDFDHVEMHNLDRLLHATAEDAAHQRPKVNVLGRQLQFSATAKRFTLEALPLSICEEPGFRSVLDCDVIFSCVDRPWPRHILNFIAYTHLIPVIDGGICIETKKSGELRTATMRAHIAAPGHRCLACLNQYDPSLVSLEKTGLLDDPHYINTLPDDHLIFRNENVFPFSLMTASLELSHFLHMIIGPEGLTNIPPQLYHFTIGELQEEKQICEVNCPFPSLIAKGDHSDLIVTGIHKKVIMPRKNSKTFRLWVRILRQIILRLPF